MVIVDERRTRLCRRHLEVSVDHAAIRHNAGVLVDAAARSGAGVMAVVKADGYGHGAVDSAFAALAAGCVALGVCTIGEALELRAAGIAAPVLAWLQNPLEDVALAVQEDIDVAVCSRDGLERAVAAAREVGRHARIHVEVDTGLSRSGASLGATRHLLHRAASAQARGDVAVVSLFSHLSHGEVPAHPTIDAQAARFEWAWSVAREAGLRPLRHLAGSLPALSRPDLHYDLVRPGAALYGLLPSGPRRRFDLRLAMRATSRVALVRAVPAGQGVSYGHQWVAPRATRLALVPVGFADGIPQALSGRFETSIAGRRLRAVGRICMDQFVVDCGDAPVAEGDEVVLLGPGLDGEPTVYDWSGALGTAPSEIVANLGTAGRARGWPA
jgi:alanine racemase